MSNMELSAGDSEEEEPVYERKRRSRKRDTKKRQKEDRLHSKQLFTAMVTKAIRPPKALQAIKEAEKAAQLVLE